MYFLQLVSVIRGQLIKITVRSASRVWVDKLRFLHHLNNDKRQEAIPPAAEAARDSLNYYPYNLSITHYAITALRTTIYTRSITNEKDRSLSPGMVNSS